MTVDLQPLRDWLARYPTPDPAAVEYREGSSTTLADGRRSFTTGRYAYSPAFDALWAALEAAGWTVEDTRSYDAVIREWQSVHGPGSTDASYARMMDRHTLLNVFRCYQRGERFCDGVWAGAWKNGFFHAGARALLELG